VDYRTVILLVFLYFVRPQDWVPGMSGLEIMKPLALLALLSMALRPRGFSAYDLLRTPLDWVFLVFWLYVAWTAPGDSSPLVPFGTLVAYHVLTSQALHTPERLNGFLHAWLAGMFVVALMGMAVLVGVDITGAKPIMEDRTVGRLIVNTYLFNNPNALGHSCIVLVILLYFVFVWKRNLLMRLAGLALVMIPLTVLYHTQSKGAFIAGFAAFSLAQLFGRPRSMQLILAVLAVAIGTSSLALLPRMVAIGNLRDDEGVQGRLMAWEQARTVVETHPYGEGFQKFVAWISIPNSTEVEAKDAHSSYIKIAADLGWTGLAFYLAVLVCSLRILMTMPGPDVEMERARRALFGVLCAFIISGWMINRSYHLEYFILAGAIAAYHRQILACREAAQRLLNEEEAVAQKAALVGETPAAVPTNPELAYPPEAYEISLAPADGTPPDPWYLRLAQLGREEWRRFVGMRLWQRYGVIDLGLALLAANTVVFFWDYVLKNL
jgi:hypothetical protein